MPYGKNHIWASVVPALRCRLFHCLIGRNLDALRCVRTYLGLLLCRCRVLRGTDCCASAIKAGGWRLKSSQGRQFFCSTLLHAIKSTSCKWRGQSHPVKFSKNGATGHLKYLSKIAVHAFQLICMYCCIFVHYVVSVPYVKLTYVYCLYSYLHYLSVLFITTSF